MLKEKMIALILVCVELTGLNAQTVKDIDGNMYNTVKIGTQVWMKENLNVTRLNNGAAIPEVKDSAEWTKLSTPGMCWHDNDRATYTSNKYGALYNWYTVATNKLCPIGWHVSTDAEWTKLIEFVGHDPAIKLKAVGSYWTYEDEEVPPATDESGFSALPAGYRDFEGTISNNNSYADFWSAEAGVTHSMNYDNNIIINSSGYSGKGLGGSIRCLKD